MFCVKCGKEIKEGSKFCTNCGAEVKEEKKEKKVEAKEDDKLTYSQNKTMENNTVSVPAVESTSTGDGKGTASLVLGIVSLVVPCVGLITSIIGLILGICAKKSGKKTAGIIINSICLGLTLLGWILVFSLGLFSWSSITGTATVNPIKPSTIIKPSAKVSNKTIAFDDYEITIGNKYTITKVTGTSSTCTQYAGQDVIKLPVTIKNVTTEDNKHLNMFYHSYEGPTGTTLPKLGGCYSSDSLDYVYVDSNETATKYIYLLYDGNGTYKIKFNNYKEKQEVEVTIKK